MRTLIFFRHGKAEPEAPGERDRDRKLNDEGEAAARCMGRFLRRAGQVPESAVASSAARAVATLELARKAGAWRTRVRVTETLYASDASVVLEEIRDEADEAASLVLVGHEPTWSRMIADFTGGGDVSFPSGAMARVDLEVDSWSDVRPRGGGCLIWVVPPKLFTAGEFDFAR